MGSFAWPLTYLAAAVVAALDGHGAPPARSDDILAVIVRASA